MKNYVSNNILTGCLLAFVLGLLTMAPILRWFVWILALGMYIWLGNRIVTTGRESLETAESPNMVAMGWSALAGFIAGLVGAVVVLLFHYIMRHALPQYDITTARSDLLHLAVLRGVATMATLVVYPSVGTLVCGFSGLMFGNGLHKTSSATQEQNEAPKQQ
jgi:hypothetical protein